MLEQIDFLWVLSVFITGWAGYRLAERYQIPPMAGFALGVGFNVAVVADRQAVSEILSTSAELVAILIAFVLLLVLTLFALAGVEKSLQVLKVTATVCLLAVGFSILPRGEANTEVPKPTFAFVLPDGVGYTYIPRSSLPKGVQSHLEATTVVIQLLARVGSSTPLYHAVGEPPVSGRRTMRRGAWVIVQDTVTDKSGQTWVKVLVADSEGRYQEATSAVGYLPSDQLSFHVPVPAFAD